MARIGIIPFDMKGDALAILFVTSQTRGRWIFPKGVAKPGESHAETCHREGFEESGVRGTVLEDFPMTVLVGRQTKSGLEEIVVTYYPFLVDEQADSWPEEEKRQRHWALVQDANKVAYRADFSDLIDQFTKLLPWIKETAKDCKSKPKEALTPAQ